MLVECFKLFYGLNVAGPDEWNLVSQCLTTVFRVFSENNMYIAFANKQTRGAKFSLAGIYYVVCGKHVLDLRKGNWVKTFYW